jgi:citronellol/citronellal dehydrogenase
MFTIVTAAEWARYGIRSNCVAAGAIESPRAVAAWRVGGRGPEEMGAAIPLGRTGTPDEMANMIVFFASDAASYVTGQVIAVNGGTPMGGLAD